MKSQKKPLLSVIVILYNMCREAERTLRSLSAAYQHGVDESMYDVIVIDNGSTDPLTNTDLSRFGSNFRYQYCKDAHASPVFTINEAVAGTDTEYVAIVIDGAHIFTPGILEYAFKSFKVYENPLVATKYFFLGPGQQNQTIFEGYDKQAEDDLLRQIGWPSDGYRLFEIGVFIGRTNPGWFQTMFESNCLLLKRKTFDALEGYDERFDLPGGGFANVDFFCRASDMPGVKLVCLLGMASFHQLHGGTTTNAGYEKQARLLVEYRQQYEAITGREFRPERIPNEYIGHMPIQPGSFFTRRAR